MGSIKYMLTTEEIIKDLRTILPIINKKFGVNTLGLFGSFSTGNQNKTSDIDILVTFNREIDLFDFIELENYLSEYLGIPVDLVLEESLKSRIKESVLTEAVSI